jgi:hypothetical protein
LEAELIEENATAQTPLTERQRREILIAAAATAALGAPARILDIRVGRWARKGRAGVHPAPPAPFFRRASTASQAEDEPPPQTQTEQGGPGE